MFSYPGTSSSSSKSLCSGRRKFEPKFIFIAAARGKSSQTHHFLWVSEVTVAIFGVQFWGFSVLRCHGVFLSGDQQQQQKPLQRQEEKVAKIYSSSKKKKPHKSSFSMGFRSYVRHFHAFSGCDFGASPSFTAMVFSHPGTSSSSKSFCRSRRKR